MAGHSMRIACLILIFATLLRESAAIPILYPASTEKSGFVEDRRSGELIPVQGAFGKFLCSEEDEDGLTKVLCEELEDKIVLWTSKTSVLFAISDVQPDGQPGVFTPESPQTNVSDPTASAEAVVQISESLFEFTLEIFETDVPIKVSWRGRSVVVIQDNTPPTSSFATADHDFKVEPPYAEFRANYSEQVVPVSNCDADLPQMSDGETVDTISQKSSACSQDLLEISYDDTYEINGVLSSRSVYDPEERELLIRGYPDSTPVADPKRILISAYLVSDKVMDYAGNKMSVDRVVSGTRYTPPDINAPPPPSSPSPPPVPDQHQSDIIPMNETKTAENVGKATSAVVVATTVSTLSTSVVVAATTSAATAAAGATGGAGGVTAAASGTSSLGGVVSILNMGQKIFLTSQLAVNVVPENYRAFADQMQWTVLDIKGPWEKSDEDKRVSLAAGNQIQKLVTTPSGGIITKLNDGTEDESAFKKISEFQDQLYEGDNPYRVVRRVIFWAFILHLVVFVLHALLVFLLKKKGIVVPPILYFPRLEIVLAYWTMPAIATACAGMLQGDTSQKAWGSVLLVLFPGSFLLFHLYVIYKNFIAKNPDQWQAKLLLDADEHHKTALQDEKDVARRALKRTIKKAHGSTSTQEEGIRSVHPNAVALVIDKGEESSKQKGPGVLKDSAMEGSVNLNSQASSLAYSLLDPEKGGKSRKDILKECFKKLDLTFCWVWLGPPMVKGSWKKTDNNDCLLHRYGPMFEDCRGAAFVMKRPPNFTFDPTTGKFDRGEYELVEQPIPLMPQCSPVRLHHMQVFGTVANYVKLILFAVIIGSEDQDESLSQLVILLVFASGFVLFLRMCRPQMERIDLALTMLAEGADIVIFILGLCLIMGPAADANFRRNIGIAMLWTEGIAFGLTVLEKLIAVLSKIIEKVANKCSHRRFKKSKGAELANALWSVLTTHPAHLERKFFDRWMLRSLGRGLNDRILVSEERIFVKKKFQKEAVDTPQQAGG